MYNQRCSSICSRAAWRCHSRNNVRLLSTAKSRWYHDRFFLQQQFTSCAALTSSSHHHHVHHSPLTLSNNVYNNSQQFRNLSEVSEAQRRSAQLELDRMKLSTSRLLQSMNTTISEAIVNEARVAIHYWSRRWYMHYHPGFGRAAKGSVLSLDALRKWDADNNNNNNSNGRNNDDDMLDVDFATTSNNSSSTQKNHQAATTTTTTTSGDYGAKQAELLLNWSISNNLIEHGLFNNDSIVMSSSYSSSAVPQQQQQQLLFEQEKLGSSPNLMCVNIIETYLLPTAYGGAGVSTSSSSSSSSSHDEALDNNDSNMDIVTEGVFASDGSDNQYARSSKHFTINPSYVRAVSDATRIMKQMKYLQTQHPKYIYPDTLSIKAELNIWSKRAILLGKNQQLLNDYEDKKIVARSVLSDKVGSFNNVIDPKDMLKRLELEDHETSCEMFEYGDEAYTLQGCLDQMEHILAEAEELYVSTKDERILPSCDWYNHVLGAWARSFDIERALIRSKEILYGMEAYDDNNGYYDKNRKNNQGASADGNFRQCWASPNTVSYNSVMFCLTRDSTGGQRIKEKTAKEALELLQRMRDRYHRTKNADIKPDEITYGSVLHALAQAGMGNDAERLLESLEDDTRNDAIVPTLTIYNSVLNAWANSFQRNAPHRAESLLERMKILSKTGKNTNVEPDSISISTVISAHARSKTRRGAERGEQMLNEAIVMYSKGNSRVKPDSIMFNCAIQGWTNISGSESEQGGVSSNVVPAERAERLLRQMKDASDARPVAQTFNIILDCWAKSEIKGSAERAVKLLREMSDYNVTPDEVSYNSALHAMTKEGDPKWVRCAEDMFQEMKDKNIPISQITYHVLMNIYSKSKDPDGARKAEELLRGMKKEDFSLNDFSYNICIDGYARRGDHRRAESLLEEMISLTESGNLNCQPTIHSFASVVNALAKSGDVDAVPRAKAIIQKVEELEYVTPNSILYNSLIDCLVKSGHKENASEAEHILLRMEEMSQSGNANIRPNSYAYSMVMTCCARSKEPDAAERANRILLKMEKLYDEGYSDAAANSRCYSAAITAWARSTSPDAPNHAFALIDRMEENGRSGSPHSKPNAHCYNACIHAIAKSQMQGKATKCREVLQRMKAARDDGFYDSAPNLITYSTIINACAFTSGGEEEKKEAFDLARTCFQILLESKDMDPDVSSFTNFFLVIARHLKPGPIRDHFSEAIFHEGCKRGKIGKQVLDNFRKASPSVASRVLSEHRVLPTEWKNNIKHDGYKSL